MVYDCQPKDAAIRAPGGVSARKVAGPPECGGLATSKPRASSQGRGLERKLESELDETGVVHSRVHRAKTQRTNVINWRTELRVIEKVEELRPEIQAHVFPRQREFFDYGEVGIDEIRTVDGNTGSVAKFTQCGLRKTGFVNVLELGLIGVGVAAGNLVRTLKSVAVATRVEGDT
jgi:hypothetical protein